MSFLWIYGSLGLLGGWWLHRRSQLGVLDTLLVVFAWPLYGPLLWKSESDAGQSPSALQIEAELTALEQTLAKFEPTQFRRCLPTAQHLKALRQQLHRLDEKVRALAGELRKLGAPEARLHQRLSALQEQSLRERDELLGLAVRLRQELTVLHYSKNLEQEEFHTLASALLGRLEGLQVVSPVSLDVDSDRST